MSHLREATGGARASSRPIGDMEQALTEQIPYLRRYATVLCRDRDRADDLVQECLLRAIDNIHQFQPGTNLRAWLFTILRNAHLNHCRRNQRYHVQSLDDSEDGWDSSVQSSQTEVLALKELERCLMMIPAPQREALLLVVVEGMTYEEAAVVMTVPVGTIRSRISRARRALMGLYEQPEHAADVKSEPEGDASFSPAGFAGMSARSHPHVARSLSDLRRTAAPSLA